MQFHSGAISELDAKISSSCCTCSGGHLMSEFQALHHGGSSVFSCKTPTMGWGFQLQKTDEVPTRKSQRYQTPPIQSRKAPWWLIIDEATSLRALRAKESVFLGLCINCIKIDGESRKLWKIEAMVRVLVSNVKFFFNSLFLGPRYLSGRINKWLCEHLHHPQLLIIRVSEHVVVYGTESPPQSQEWISWQI